MMKYQGHYYETVDGWYPVVIQSPTSFMDKIVLLPSWLSEHCPDADTDYDAWVYADDNLMDDNHRSIYFFREHKVAVMFALRWS